MAEPLDEARSARWAWGDDDYALSQCVTCLYKFVTGAACAAFPDGIPDAILANVHDHREPYPGDRGIRYKERPQPKE